MPRMTLPPPARELGYAEITSNFTVTRAGSDLTSNVTNLFATVTIGTRPFIVHAGSSFLQHGADGGGARASIFDGATELARSQRFITATGTGTSATPWYCWRRLASYSPGASVTFQVKLSSLFVNGAAVMDATVQPAWIQVVEIQT